jgi:hypothetical protein
VRLPAGSSRASGNARFRRIIGKTRETVCRVGEAGHFAINAGTLKRGDRISGSFKPLAITLPTSRLSPVVPTVPVELPDMSAPYALYASRNPYVDSRADTCVVLRAPRGQASAGSRFLALLAVVLACAAAPGLAVAQTPKPIDPGMSVTASPLDSSEGAVSAGSGSGNAGASASALADPNGFQARQKDLNHRSEVNDYHYAVVQHDCYSKFFVNHCLDQARDAKRTVSNQIRQEQLALDDEQRLLHAQQRDAQTAAQRAQYAAEAPQRAANEKAAEASYAEKQRQNQLAAAQRTAEAPQRAANQAAYDQKQADYQKKLADAAARGKQDAIDRDQKADRYDAKQREAAEHATEVAARQKQAAEKQQQREQQAQQQQQQQQPSK